MKLSNRIFTYALSVGAISLHSSTLLAKETSEARVKPRSWAQSESDIKPDAKIIYGTLPNGMRYLLMPNKQPPGRVSMRLHIAAGSLMERDDQRGVAHFLEHMVLMAQRISQTLVS